LAVRVRKHLKGNSAIYDLMRDCISCQNLDPDIENFKILSSGNSDLEIKVK
jgi:hypothetical protein